MKYIKTKDGKLYLNLGETQNGVVVEYNYLGDGLDLAVNYDAIEKQADTIKDLCDEFIFTGSSFSHFRTEGYGSWNGTRIEKDKDMYKELQNNGCVFYGAIWTDKGLIYVAKMNEKGELELL